MAIARAASEMLYPTTCKAFSSVRFTKIWSYTVMRFSRYGGGNNSLAFLSVFGFHHQGQQLEGIGCVVMILHYHDK